LLSVGQRLSMVMIVEMEIVCTLERTGASPKTVSPSTD
jgi:hypothetical protein